MRGGAYFLSMHHLEACLHVGEGVARRQHPPPADAPVGGVSSHERRGLPPVDAPLGGVSSRRGRRG